MPVALVAAIVALVSPMPVSATVNPPNETAAGTPVESSLLERNSIV